MAAGAAGDAVVLAEHVGDTGGDGLLGAVEVRRAVHLALEEERLHGLLEAADRQHRAVEVGVERALGIAPAGGAGGWSLGERRGLLAWGHGSAPWVCVGAGGGGGNDGEGGVAVPSPATLDDQLVPRY